MHNNKTFLLLLLDDDREGDAVAKTDVIIVVSDEVPIVSDVTTVAFSDSTVVTAKLANDVGFSRSDVVTTAAVV